MGETVNVTLPDKVAEYLKRKAREEYLPLSAVARQYVAKGVIDEMILDYHRKGFSIHKIAELTEAPISRVLEVLSKLGEELEDLEEELTEMEKQHGKKD